MGVGAAARLGKPHKLGAGVKKVRAGTIRHTVGAPGQWLGAGGQGPGLVGWWWAGEWGCWVGGLATQGAKVEGVGKAGVLGVPVWGSWGCYRSWVRHAFRYRSCSHHATNVVLSTYHATMSAYHIPMPPAHTHTHATLSQRHVTHNVL